MMLKVRMLHDCSIPSLRWVDPVGWEPSDVIDGLKWTSNAWWGDDDEEAYGLAWVGDVNAYGVREVTEVDADDLRIVSCGDCRVICKPQIGEPVEDIGNGYFEAADGTVIYSPEST